MVILGIIAFICLGGVIESCKKISSGGKGIADKFFSYLLHYILGSFCISLIGAVTAPIVSTLLTFSVIGYVFKEVTKSSDNCVRIIAKPATWAMTCYTKVKDAFSGVFGSEKVA